MQARGASARGDTARAQGAREPRRWKSGGRGSPGREELERPSREDALEQAIEG